MGNCGYFTPICGAMGPYLETVFFGAHLAGAPLVSFRVHSNFHQQKTNRKRPFSTGNFQKSRLVKVELPNLKSFPNVDQFF